MSNPGDGERGRPSGRARRPGKKAAAAAQDAARTALPDSDPYETAADAGRAAASSGPDAAETGASSGTGPRSAEDRIIDAFMARLATTPFSRIEPGDVARDAGISLAELRRRFDSRLDIVAAFVRRIDAEVLEGIDPALAGEPARDRLFDVLMRRLDRLAPYKDAVRMVRRDPAAVLALVPVVASSMGFMLAAASIPTASLRGHLRAHALALAWGRILDVWFCDTDPGLSRTMVAVDKALSRGERAEAFTDRLCRVACCLRRPGEGRRRAETATEGAAGEGI